MNRVGNIHAICFVISGDFVISRVKLNVNLKFIDCSFFSAIFNRNTSPAATTGSLISSCVMGQVHSWNTRHKSNVGLFTGLLSLWSLHSEFSELLSEKNLINIIVKATTTNAALWQTVWKSTNFSQKNKWNLRKTKVPIMRRRGLRCRKHWWMRSKLKNWN